MSYLLGWLVYLLAAFALVGIYYRYLERLLPGDWGRVLGVLMLAVLFTPWVVEGSDHYLPVPAFIAALFSLLSHSRYEAWQAMLPIAGVSTVLLAVLLFRVKPEAAE